MTVNEIAKKIVELKLVKPQTQEIKLKIQKLQQKLNKLLEQQNVFLRNIQTKCVIEYQTHY